MGGWFLSRRDSTIAGHEVPAPEGLEDSAQGFNPRIAWREDKEDVCDLFCLGFAAKSRSIFKFSSLP